MNTKKNIDMLVKVRENLVGGCAKNSSDAQLAWRRVAIAIDCGVCDSVTWPEHVPDHEVHESVESQRGEKFQSATGEPIRCVRRPTVATVHEGRTSLRHGHESFACDRASGLVKKICQASHTVVFDYEGEVNRLREEDGNYMLDAWIPPPQQGSNKTNFHLRP